MISCKECGKKVNKYKSKQLCDSCYNKILDRNKIPQICKTCNGLKICRYTGPICSNCYNKYENTENGKRVLLRNRRRSYFPPARFSRGKSEAKRRKIVWELTLQQYIDLIQKECYYCGVSMENETGVGLDRIDNNKTIGYVMNNVLTCCGSCNQIRGSNLTVEETKVAISAILSYRKEFLGKKNE